MMMADALVGATVKIALQKVVSFATDQIGMVMGFQEDLDRLRGTVEMILAVVDDAEEKQVNDRAVNLWLKKLEELACRADLVLDELNYEMLRRGVEDKSWLKGKVRFFSSHNTTAFHWRMARKFRDINKKFELINKEATAFGLQFRVGSVANSTLLLTNTGISMNREKDSIVAQNVVGRENNASKIVEKLLSPSIELLSFIPITGMGGIGKTTVARCVYNNELIVKHFGKKIWVSVSENFEPKRIFKLMLESLTKNHVASLESRDVLVQKVKEKLQGARYLLVLDDVWSENCELWEDFLCSLTGISATPGNWIIVTTRKLQVALNLPPGYLFPLEKLSDQDSLCIVKEKACLRVEGIQEFESIREKIIELCQGLPLAASVIGGLLRANPREEWLSVLSKGISSTSGDEYSSVMQILKLSFDHLPSPALKKCFIYCSLFNKDSLLKKEQLVELWMAEGFLQPNLNNELEIIGNQYINSLVQSSLLQEVIDEDGESSSVRMHDLVHDLAQLISGSKNDVGDGSFGEETKTLPKERMRMLRTLGLESYVHGDMLTGFKYLHVLKLSHVGSELTASIGKLIHLRYLHLSGSLHRDLPESLCKLYNLQTLRINDCYVCGALPKGMTKLISLRHLHVDKYQRMPPKIGQLTCLRTLEFFHVRGEKDYQIKELGGLDNLRGQLSIFSLEEVKSKEEALQARLYRKQITKLKFYWSGEGENDEGVLDGLQPHPTLKELWIESFSGSQFPLWVMNMAVCMGQNLGLSTRLDKLVTLTIMNCKRCKQVPALGQLPLLKHLELEGLDNISCIDYSFYGINDNSGSGINIGTSQVPKKIFPTLKCLKVESMKNLKEWKEPKTANGEVEDLFPNLEELIIRDCFQLTSAPTHFSSLKRLVIRGASLYHVLPTAEINQDYSRSPHLTHIPRKGIPTFLESLSIRDCKNLRELPQSLYLLQSLSYLEIWDCPDLKSFAIPSGQQRLTSLQELTIAGCHGLTSLPCELLQSCASLEKFSIVGCNGLTSLPRELLESCASLEKLIIAACRGLSSLPCELLGSCASLEKLSIVGCHGLICLPCELLESCASLEEIIIRDCDGLKTIPNELLNPCASLRALHISKLSNLDSFGFDLRRMPSLSSLELFQVPKLITVPKLEIVSYCVELRFLKNGGFFDSVESWFLDKLQHLTDLRESNLLDLGQIEALFANAVSLEKLWLCECEKLHYFRQP